MEDKLEEVIKQYPVLVKRKRRTRGAIMLETDLGLLLLKEYGVSPSRIEFEENIKQHLTAQGYSNVDITIKNSKGDYQTKDMYGNYWVIRHWFNGAECDIRDAQSICKGAAHLGKLHRMMQRSELRELGFIQNEGLPEELERHNREMKRVRSYIRGKRQKNEMEICLLNSFPDYYQQACLAQTLMQESDYPDLWKQTADEGRVQHGNYTYHNILFGEKDIITTSFERAEIGLQVEDLYGFLRKVMEKNGWKWELGSMLISSYQKERKMEEAEKKILYILLLYPQKYWKLVNFYYNGRKSWLPARNLEKLMRIRGQEEERVKFLAEAKRLLF